MLLSLILNLAMTGAIVPEFYPFQCDQVSVIHEKQSQECETTVMTSQNTNNKTIINSLNNCS